MNGPAADGTRTTGSPLRLRFSLLALLAFITLVCLALAWFVQPQRVVVEALFQVSATQSVLVGSSQPSFDAHEYEVLRESCVELIKSDRVLASAVRDPTIASLPLVARHTDPVEWLSDNLEAEFVGQSELLAIRLRGTKSQGDDLRQIVDAASNAFANRAVFEERQRQLQMRDAKATCVQQLREEIEAKKLHIELQKSDANDTAARLDQAEVDVLLDLWRDLVRSLEIDDINQRSAPDRIRPFQPALIREE